MGIEELIKLPPGTKVYKVHNGKIRDFRTIGLHPTENNYFGLISGANVHDATYIYIPTENTEYFTDYHDVKEEYWKESVRKIQSINEIYMQGKKTVVFDDILQLGTPWPLKDQIKKLVEAAELLLSKHSHDGQGHEDIREAIDRATETLKILNKKPE